MCLFPALSFWLFCSFAATDITVVWISVLVGASLGRSSGRDPSRFWVWDRDGVNLSGAVLSMAAKGGVIVMLCAASCKTTEDRPEKRQA